MKAEGLSLAPRPRRSRPMSSQTEIHPLHFGFPGEGISTPENPGGGRGRFINEKELNCIELSLSQTTSYFA